MSVVLKSLSDPKLVELLKSGRIAVIPTDTVYGLVCLASNEAAVRRLYKLKSRESKPGTVVAASIEQLVELGIKARYLKAVEHFWPNPITIVVPNYGLDYVHLGKGSIAVRVPKHQDLQSMLIKTGPLLTTSANHPDEPTASTIEKAIHYFGDDVDAYVDGGDLSGREPSTLIRIVDDEVEVLREGAVKISGTGAIET